LFEAYGRRGGDALIEEIIFAAPDAGVVVGLGREQADNGAEAVATSEGLSWRLGRLAGWPANGEANFAFDRGIEIGVVCDDFEGRDAKIDALGRALCSGGCVKILLEFEADGAGVDNRTLDGAQQAIRECGKGRRGSGMRLHFGAPAAEQDPQGGQWKPGNAFGAKCGEDTEGGYEDDSDKHQSGAEPDPMGNGDSGGEKPRGMEERNLRQSLA
jgi:hypothetical protein